MIVAELIAALQQHPADALVLVSGFDSWQFDRCAAPEQVRVVPVKQTSHGPSFAEDDESSTRHHEVIGSAINAIYLGIA